MKLSPVVQAVGVSGLLSAFGYTALRAHWNFLGVTVAGGGVPAERFIAETWSVIGALVPLLFLAVMLLLLAWALAIGGRKLLARFAPAAPERIARSLPLLLLIALIVAEVLVLRTISSPDPLCRVDVVLGDLRSKHEAGCFAPDNGAPVFVLVMALVAAAFAATRGETLTGLQLAVRVAAVAIALQLPAVYGYRIKQPIYPVVRVVAGGKAVDGFLMLQTSNSIQLWDAGGAHGRMRILPASGLSESGPALDLFDVASQVATSPDPNAFQTLCRRYLPPGGS